jgi:paraquat-inducible protein B
MNNNSSETASQVTISKKEGISAVWLVPIIALLFGSWLLAKAVMERGTFITVQFDSARGIVVGKTEVRYKGLVAGVVSDVEVSEDLQSVIVEIEMIPTAAKVLTDKTLFWYVTADVSFQGVKGLDTILSGSYINIQPDTDLSGSSQRHFIALKEEPTLDFSTPGLHITLHTKTLGSLGKQSPVSFKQITVGHISGFKYNEQTNLVDINVFIQPRYANLVKESSRFWNASGFDISGSLTSGVNVRTQSLASIISGGIAFDNSIVDDKKITAINGSEYQLHPDFKTAEMGHEITLTLNWDSGVDRGAAVMYQGIKLGEIDTFLKIDAESRKITAKAKIDPRVIPYLTDDTQFFVVSPTIDLSGVTNFNSLLAGTHIGFRPSLTGTAKSDFILYNHKPAYSYNEPGLHLILHSNDAGSLVQGTGVYYHQQRVGDIQEIINTGPSKFIIHIFIDPKYQSYVSTDSRFWNASGVNISGGLQSFEVKAQSLQSILKGGIAFDEGLKEELPENGTNFDLFSSIDIAKQREIFTLKIPSAKGLSTKTRIRYRGETIGSVHKISHENDAVTLQVGVLPNFKHLLKVDSQFWLVRPQLTLSGMADTDAIFGGAYITLTAGTGVPHRQFLLSNVAPAKHISAAGLQLALVSPSGNVVSPGNPISYRGITIGQVDNVALDHKGINVNIHISIDDEYRHLINNSTRFYNASGITASGGISNFIVKTESMDSILRGGISFYNPENEQLDGILKEGQNFTLYQHIDHARSAGLAITIDFDEIAGLKSNLKIKYKDQTIGHVERLVFDSKVYGTKAIAYLNDAGRHFAVKDSKFWLSQPEVGLVGNKNFNAILEGGFISVKPGKSVEQSSHFKAYNIPPVVEQLPYGLNLRLSAKTLGSVRVGDPVLYRQIKVGKVIGTDLSQQANMVDIFINIATRYAPLVTDQSKFWNSSGIQIEAGLFSGVSIKSESIETLLAGGIAFATPDVNKNVQGKAASSGQTYPLHDEVQAQWQAWQPEIQIEK